MLVDGALPTERHFVVLNTIPDFGESFLAADNETDIFPAEKEAAEDMMNAVVRGRLKNVVAPVNLGHAW